MSCRKKRQSSNKSDSLRQMSITESMMLVRMKKQVKMELNSVVIEINSSGSSDDDLNDQLVSKHKKYMSKNEQILKRKANPCIITSTPIKKMSMEKTHELLSPIASESSSTVILNEESTSEALKSVNLLPLNLFTDLLVIARNTKEYKQILKEDYPVIDVFLKLPIQYKFVIFKFFIRQEKWKQIFNFVEDLKIELNDEEVQRLYEDLVEKGFFDTNVAQDDIYTLLNNLSRDQILTLYKKYKLKGPQAKKETMVDRLVLTTKKQGCLSFAHPEQVMMGHIKKIMIYYVKLKVNVSEAFHNCFLLSTFVNRSFYVMSDFLFTMPKLVFPEFKVDETVVFKARKEFRKYAEARKFSHEIQECKDLKMVYETAEVVFTQLQLIVEERNIKSDNLDSNSQLKHFSAKYEYISILSYSAKRLLTNYPDEVLNWLTFLIQNFGENRQIGHWYLNLSWINIQYLKPPNKERAAELLIEALTNKKQFFSEVVLHELGQRGRKLLACKKGQISENSFVELNEVLPTDFPKFPTCPTIIANCLKSNKSGKKRDYFVDNLDGSRNFMAVEDYAKRYYIENEYFENGSHCEGYLFQATYLLFFHDIIYTYIPGSFISKYQIVPLDFFSKTFYQNRRALIDKRLQAIEYTWNDKECLDFLMESWQKNSKKSSFISLQRIVEEPTILNIILTCVPRNVLSSIYARFAQCFGDYKSGMPDLLMWDTSNQRYKMVEVKGHGDTLQINQKVWIQYLLNSGAVVEVCNVNSQAKKK